MRSLDRVLIQYDWCPHKKRAGHRSTAGRQPGERPRKNATLPTPRSRTSSLWDWEKVNLRCVSLPVCGSLRWLSGLMRLSKAHLSEVSYICRNSWGAAGCSWATWDSWDWGFEKHQELIVCLQSLLLSGSALPEPSSCTWQETPPWSLP